MRPHGIWFTRCFQFLKNPKSNTAIENHTSEPVASSFRVSFQPLLTLKITLSQDSRVVDATSSSLLARLER